MLFVGYHLGDADFRLLWQSIQLQQGAFAIGAYAVAPELSPTERRVWQKQQIRFLDAQPLTLLEQLAVATAAKSDQPSIPENPAPDPVQPPPVVPVTAPSFQPSPDDINSQYELLEAHRRTLAIYLLREASVAKANVPPEVANGMHEARKQIARIKATLRAWGVQVENHPDD